MIEYAESVLSFLLGSYADEEQIETEREAKQAGAR